jgi:hypothetical protein
MDDVQAHDEDEDDWDVFTLPPGQKEHVLMRVVYRSPRHLCSGADCPFLVEMDNHRG